MKRVGLSEFHPPTPQRPESKAIGRIVVVVTIVILIGIAAVAFFTLDSPAPQAPVIGARPLIRGSMLANSSTGAGFVNPQVSDPFGHPFTGMVLTGVRPPLPGLVDNVTFTYNGMAVSATNPLPLGGDATGAAEFSSGGKLGSDHTVTAVIQLANGQGATESYSFTVSALTTGTIGVPGVTAGLPYQVNVEIHSATACTR